MSANVFDPQQVDETAQFALGTVLYDHRQLPYRYVKAAAAITAQRTVVVNETYDARHVLASNAAKGDRTAVAETAIPSGDYGWVSHRGTGDIQVLASCAANTQLYTSATSGALDDDSSSQEAVDGIVLTTARSGSAGTAPAVWDFPRMG